MKENFVYPARVKEENGLLQLKFLDFPEITLIEEETMDELIRSAQDSPVSYTHLTLPTT